MAHLIGVWRPANMRAGLCAEVGCQNRPVPDCEHLSVLPIPPLCREHLDEIFEREVLDPVHES